MGALRMHFKSLKLISLENSKTFRPHLTLHTHAMNSLFKPSKKYAIIELGGAQMIVQEGRYYSCNRLKVKTGSKVKFGRVLAVKNEGEFHLGEPWMESASVKADIVNEFKGKKITVFKMKPKK